jgi:hypothetical protein
MQHNAPSILENKAHIFLGKSQRFKNLINNLVKKHMFLCMLLYI